MLLDPGFAALSFGLKFGDDLRLIGGDIFCFSGVGREIVKLRIAYFGLGVLRGRLSHSSLCRWVPRWRKVFSSERHCRLCCTSLWRPSRASQGTAVSGLGLGIRGSLLGE